MDRTPEGPTGGQSASAALDADPGLRPGSLDAVFDVLSAERRRHVLYVLYRRAEPVAIADLADAVTSNCGANLARVAAELYHVHLPKLDEAGIVEYDREAGTVALANPSDRFDRYLAAAADDECESLRRASGCATLSEF